MCHSNQRGFTIPELVVAAGILSTVLVMFLGLEESSTGLQATGYRTAWLRSEARQALEEMTKHLRMADKSNLFITNSAGTTQIVFQVPESYSAGQLSWSNVLTFASVPSQVDSNRNEIVDERRIIFVKDGRTHVLCHHVKQDGLTLVRTGDQIRIRLDLASRDDQGHMIEVSYETSVVLRNSSS